MELFTLKTPTDGKKPYWTCLLCTDITISKGVGQS